MEVALKMISSGGDFKLKTQKEKKGTFTTIYFRPKQFSHSIYQHLVAGSPHYSWSWPRKWNPSSKPGDHLLPVGHISPQFGRNGGHGWIVREWWRKRQWSARYWGVSAVWRFIVYECCVFPAARQKWALSEQRSRKVKPEIPPGLNR